VRVCIIGAGLAGSLLAWRLAQATTGWRIDLMLGVRPSTSGDLPGDIRDATAASGGAVRAFEAHPEQRRLAIASMVELLASRTLRQWSDYRPAHVVNLRRTAAGLDAALAEIELMLPGSAWLADADDLRRAGWADLHDGAVAVVERSAGYTSPARWRHAVLADLRRRVEGRRVEVTAVTPRDDGTLHCTTTGGIREYDAVVVAAGAWTAALLRASGLPAQATGYRTKSIQYALHQVRGWCPPQFVDEVTGLYGRPTAGGELLLGLPTELWDVDPDRPPTTPQLLEDAARLAAARFPRLRLGPVTAMVGSADCYAEQPVLSLRPVISTAGLGHRLFTFSGGAGGSVKTALAASQRAAIQLAEPDPFSEVSVGCRKGQP
jgi:glycine/D-amino acid oxidase-like deaminating enzyme